MTVTLRPGSPCAASPAPSASRGKPSRWPSATWKSAINCRWTVSRDASSVTARGTANCANRFRSCSRGPWSAPHPRTASCTPSTRWTAWVTTSPRSVAAFPEYNNYNKETAMRRTLISCALLLATGHAAASTAWVSNEKDNSLSLIDMQTLQVTDTLAVGQRPRGLLLSHDNKLLYICASDSDRVQVMDVATRKIIKELPSGKDPEQFALHPNNRWLYVSNEDDALVTVIDTETSKVLGQINVGVEPEGMVVSPDGKWAVNTSETTNMLHWIDTGTQTLADNTLVDQRPRFVEFNPDGSQLWASAEIGGTVTVLDVASRKVLKTLTFKIKGVHPDKVQPAGIKLSSDGKYAFVALGPANHVAVIDAKTFEILDYLLVGRRVWQMAFTPDEKQLLATNGVSGDVSVIDVDSLKVLKSVKVGRYPWGVVVTP